MWIYKALINNRNSNFYIGAKHSWFLSCLWGTVTWIWGSFAKSYAMIDHPLGLFHYTVCVKLPYFPPDSNTRDIHICLRLTTFNSNKFSHKEAVSFDCGQSQNLLRGFSFNRTWQDTWRCAQMWNHSFPYGRAAAKKRNNATLYTAVSQPVFTFLLLLLSPWQHDYSQGLVFTFCLS